MDQNLKRLQSETDEQYFYRVCKMKDALGFTWPQMAEIFNEEFGCNKGDTAYRKKWAAFQEIFNANMDKLVGENAYLAELKQAKHELEKEKIKLQTEKLEYNRWLREEARNELIGEHIVNAIKTMPPLEIPKTIGPVFNNNKRSAVLLIADPHYGAELSIKGLFGETLNEYNPEIFEQRMWDLFNQVTYIVGKEGFTELNVYDLGDSIDGMLRVSQLMQLRYGVIESTVLYGRFITEWLNELTKYVRVKYQMVKDSNHNQLRLLNGKKNTFKNENVSYIIAEKIMDRLGDNPNFEFVQNPTGYIFDNLVGYNVLGLHGEVKNMPQAIKDFSNTYKTNIDVLVGGHKHHSNNENVGIESDAISAPSIIGIDDYSMSLNKTSDPGATLFVLEQGNGKVMEYNIKL